jgi:multicomponent Na+:H+ antiporter subunit E
LKMYKKILSKKILIPFVLLLVFWLILTPNITVESLIIGMAVSLLVVVYSQDVLFDEREIPIYRLPHLLNMIKFVGVLVVEIFKANIDVAKIVLNPSLPIQPHFIKVPMMIKNDFNKVIYGNSVTLTPGTLTVDIKEDEFIIHALTNDAADAMENSFIEQWVSKQEDES